MIKIVGWRHFCEAFDASGVVYLIGDQTGCVKIGWTSDLPRRLGQLQTGHPRTLELLAYIPGEREDESYLHRAFQIRRVRGEWFEDSDNFILNYFRNVEKRLAPLLRDIALSLVAHADLLAKDGRDELAERMGEYGGTTWFGLDSAYVVGGDARLVQHTRSLTREDFTLLVSERRERMRSAQSQVGALRIAQAETSDIWDRHPNWTWGQVEDAYATTHAVAAE